MSKVIVIGGGAAGIIAALKASEKNEVILLEGNDKIGKKILLTGNGKCNYWNDDISLDKYNTDDFTNLEEILKNKDTIYNYLESLGLYPKIKNGYYYPYSNQASSVREIFVKKLEKRNVKVITNTKVTEIKKDNEEFIIKTNDKIYKADKVVLAAGSKAYPKTGSDGSGYDILNKLNIKINPITPSLVGLKTNAPFLKDWDGIRTDVKLELFINNNKEKEEIGEIQLTDYGISGICTFNISGLATKNLYYKNNVSVKINFLPYLNESFYDWFSKRDSLIKNHTIEELLESILNYKLMFVLLKEAGIDKNKYWSDLTEKEKRNLENKIESFEIKIIDSHSFDRSQVCTGGVSLKEINPKTMNSKIKGLYIVGELLDVDGKCGGYNLAFAFITGFLAGSDLNA